MLWFEIPWIMMRSSLFEMVYLMDFYYYFTFIESQQNNEHKADKKACICNRNQVSVSINKHRQFFPRTVYNHLICFPLFPSHIWISMFFSKLCLKTILASLQLFSPSKFPLPGVLFWTTTIASSIKGTLLPLLSFRSWLFCDKLVFYIRLPVQMKEICKFHGKIFRINLF